MVVNGIWSCPFLKNMVLYLSQFTLSLFHLAVVVSLMQYLNKLLRQDAQILRDLLACGADQADCSS